VIRVVVPREGTRHTYEEEEVHEQLRFFYINVHSLLLAHCYGLFSSHDSLCMLCSVTMNLYLSPAACGIS
jgi:hypothetical protein